MAVLANRPRAEPRPGRLLALDADRDMAGRAPSRLSPAPPGLGARTWGPMFRSQEPDALLGLSGLASGYAHGNAPKDAGAVQARRDWLNHTAPAWLAASGRIAPGGLETRSATEISRAFI
jgi:hypothetical protein